MKKDFTDIRQISTREKDDLKIRRSIWGGNGSFRRVFALLNAIVLLVTMTKNDISYRTGFRKRQVGKKMKKDFTDIRQISTREKDDLKFRSLIWGGNGSFRRVFALLNAIVLLVTMTSVGFEASALELDLDAYCGTPAHLHGEACYDEQNQLICGFVEHVHTPECFQNAPEEIRSVLDEFLGLNAQVVLVSPTDVSEPAQPPAQAEGGTTDGQGDVHSQDAEPVSDEMESDLDVLTNAEDDSAEVEVPDGGLEYTYDEVYEYDVNGSTAFVGDVLDAVGIPRNDITAVGEVIDHVIVSNDEAVHFIVENVEDVEDEFQIIVRCDFDSAELGLMVNGELKTIWLHNGVALTEEAEQEPTEVGYTESPEASTPEEPGETTATEETNATEETAATEETVDTADPEVKPDEAVETEETGETEETEETSETDETGETGEAETADAVEEMAAAMLVTTLDFTDYVAVEDHSIYLYDAEKIAVFVSVDQLAQTEGVAVSAAEVEAGTEYISDGNVEFSSDGALIIYRNGVLALEDRVYVVTGLTMPTRAVTGDGIVIYTADGEATLFNVKPVIEQSDENYDELFDLFQQAEDDPSLLSRIGDLFTAHAEEVEVRSLQMELLNIGLHDLNNGSEVEPDGSVHVRVTLPRALEGVDFKLFHILDGKPVYIEDARFFINSDGNAVGLDFYVDSLSQFAITYYTVDFHYEGVDYSIPGESQILLSELIGILNIKNGDEPLNVADVEKVEFTDEHLVTVEQVSGLITYNEKKDIDVGEKDFLLTSLEPFNTDEKLTLTLTNGEEIVVGVTDVMEGYVDVGEDGYFTYGGLKYCDRQSDIGGIVCYGYDPYGDYPPNITIPASFNINYPVNNDSYENVPVVGIAQEAFKNDTHVKDATIQGDIILESEWNCGPFNGSSIVSVRFNGTNVTIGEGAFAYCYLKSVWAGNARESFQIGNWAFQGSGNLDSITAWDEAVTSFGSEPFYDTDFTKDKIVYLNAHESIKYDDGVYTFILDLEDKTAKITGLSESYSGNYNLNIPDTVTVGEGDTAVKYTVNAIADYAFSHDTKGWDIKNVKLDSTTGISIGEQAFIRCANMTGDLKGVTSVGPNAFWGTKLNSIELNISKIEDIGNWAFGDQGTSATVTVNARNLEVKHGHLSQTQGITDLTINADSISFGWWVLQGEYNGNSNLKTITINSNNVISSLPFQTFGDHHNSGFESITINAKVGTVDGEAFTNLGDGTTPVTVTFANGVNKVSDDAFKDFHGGKGSVIRIHNNMVDTEFTEGSSFPKDPNLSIVFDDVTLSYEQIHDDALTYEEDGEDLIVTGLYTDDEGNTQSTFTVPTTLTWKGKTYKVVAIKEGAFKGQSGLNVTVAGDIDVRGVYNNDNDCNGAFSNTSNITVTFNGANTTIGSAAFMKANGVTIEANNNTAFNMGRKAFFDAKNLNVTVNGGSFSIGSNTLQYATGELALMGTVTGVSDLYAVQITKLTTLGANSSMLSGFGSGWANIDVVLKAQPNDSVVWNNWGRVNSLTVDYDAKTEIVGSAGVLNNNGKPVTFNFNKGVGTIQQGAFAQVTGDGATTINIKGKSATVEENAFPDDANLTVNFDMYYEQVTGAEYNDALTQTTVNYKAHDYRKEGEEQKLLSALIEDMGLTKEDGSAIDLNEVTNVQFQGHEVTTKDVTGFILYNEKGEIPVNVGSKDILLCSVEPFTNNEHIRIILSDGTKIEKNWENLPDVYNINGNESLWLSDILKATCEEDALNSVGEYDPTGYPGWYYVVWVIQNPEDNTYYTYNNKYQWYAPENNYDVEITNLNTIPFKGTGKLGIMLKKQDNTKGYVTFATGVKYINLYQNKRNVPLTDGVFKYAIGDEGAEIVSFVDSYDGSRDIVTVPATVRLPDLDSDNETATVEYTVTRIRSEAFSGDDRLKQMAIADSDTPLEVESTALSDAPKLTKLTGNRLLKFVGTGGAVISNNPELIEVSVHVDDTAAIKKIIGSEAYGSTKKMDLELIVDDAVILGMNSLAPYNIKNFTIHARKVTLQSYCFYNNNALESLTIDSVEPTTIAAFTLNNKSELTNVTILGGVTQINTKAFEGDTALTTVKLGKADANGNYDNNGLELTIEKDAFAGCTSLGDNKVTCKQFVTSADGTVTINGVPTGVPLGAYLVKTDSEEIDETIKTFADSWYKQQGKVYPIDDIKFFDLSLVTPAGNTVTGVAVDVLTSQGENRWPISEDPTKIDKTSLALFHKTSETEVENVESFAAESWVENKLTNVTFHVDSLSPFALAVLGNRYHDDEFWYEVEPAAKTATIVGVYDESETPVTELHFTGVTHDANEFKVVGIANNALNAVAAEGKTEAAINANKAVKTVTFTNDGIKNTLKKNYNSYDLPESVFEGCTGLETATFGNSEEDPLGSRVNFKIGSFKNTTGLKKLTVYANIGVHSLGFDGDTGLETIVITGNGTNNIVNSAFVDAAGLKYLRIDNVAGVESNAFGAEEGTAFVTKVNAYNEIGSKIGKFDTYIFAGNDINEYNNVLKYNAPSTVYIEQPKPEKANQFYKQWIESAGKGLKDVYFNCDRTDFDVEVAKAIDEVAAAKDVTIHYNNNEVGKPFYLDGVNGNDANDGTYEAPFKTFAKLKEAWDAVDPEAEGESQTDTVIGPIVEAAFEAVGIESACGTFIDKVHRVQEAYIKNTVTTAGETWESSDAEKPIVLNRDPGFQGLMVQNNSGLSLKNVVLDGGSEAGVTATAPIINSKANLEIHEGAVIRNNNRTSFGYPDKAGAIYASGGVTMDGGEISGNTGAYGGGLQICGNGSVFTMSGGTIKDNQTVASKESYGGGVNVGSGATMYMSGGTIEGNKVYGSGTAVGGAGGGIAIGADVGGMCQGAKLVMTGGTIDGNESAQSGGGIFIQTNCTATITTGNITNNTAHGGAYGGGGIYANGVRDDTEDGRLYLSNVLITDNSAKETGGGYAGCCTSTAYIYMGNGAAIFGNSAGDNSDVHIGTEYHVTSWGMQSGTPYAFISQYMFDGTEYHWKDVETDEELTSAELARITTETSIRAYPEGTPNTDKATVIITGNHSDTKAGGVGSNGFVSIGDVPNDQELNWTPKGDKTIYGRDMKEGETFTFTVYEEKTSQGLSFWWTKYTDVKVGTGSVTGGKDGVATSIVFDEIPLGQMKSTDIGSTHTYLIVEDALNSETSDDVFKVSKYYAVTIVIGTKVEDGKEVYTADVKNIEIGNIDKNGYFEYDDIFYGETEPSPNATPYNNFGRIREKAKAVTFANYAGETIIQATKTWQYLGQKKVPDGAEVVFELYADNKPTGKRVTLDGTMDDGLVSGGEIVKDGEIQPWLAQWVNVPIYRTNEDGERYKIHDYDDDYARYEYAVMEVSRNPVCYTPVAESQGLTTTTQTIVYNEPHNWYYTKVTYQLYADGEPVGNPVTLDLSKSWSLKPEKWVAMWPGMPVYRLDANGKIYKENITDEDYARIVYTVELIPDQSEIVSYYTDDPAPGDHVGQQPVSVLIPVTAYEKPVSFTNVYHAKGEYELKGTKSIENRSFQSGDQWTFTVTADEGTPMPEQTEVTVKPINGTEFNVDFGKINYTEDNIGKTYTYTVTESGTVAGVVNDENVTRTIKVKVTDNGDGTLKVEATNDSQKIDYVNTYKSEGKVHFDGQKTIQNRKFIADDTLTITVEGKNGAKEPNPHTVNVNLTAGKATAVFSFADITYTHEDLKGKDSAEFEYSFTETAGMEGTSPAGRVHTAKVTVRENNPKDGKLNVNVTYDNGDGVIKKVNFINTYDATGSVKFEGEKIIENRPFKDGDALSVKVTADNGGKLPDPAEKTVALTHGQNTASFDFNTITYVLSDMDGEDEKTFTYTITETATMEGTTPDTNTHKVTVKLTDDKKGHLVPVVTYTDGDKVEFTNTYDATGSIELGGRKFIEKRSFKDGDTATFKIEAVTAGAPLPDPSEVTVEPTSGNSVDYKFNAINYTLDDLDSAKSQKTFEYKITESAFTMDGVTGDTTERIVKVTVKDNNGSGKLEVTSDLATNPANFTNTYDAAGEIELKGTKFIEGRPFKAGDTATFTVKPIDGAPEPEYPVVTINPTGGKSVALTFGKIAYKLSDLPDGAGSSKTFEYEVTESACAMDGVTKDSNTYTVEVTVADNNSGTLTVTCMNNDKLDFTNEYDANGSITLGGTKFIENRKFKDGDTATIKIEAVTAGAPVPAAAEVTVTPSADTTSQTYSFGAIDYTLANAGGANSEKTYEYKVTESASNMDGVTKDSREYTVKVTVKDDSTGELTVTSDIDKDKLDFTNTYKATGSTVLKATKKIQNRKFLEGDEWTFTVSAAEGVPLPDPASVTIKPTKDAERYDFDFAAIQYTEADIGEVYTYTITETGTVNGVTNAVAQTVTVKVEDNKDGRLKVTNDTEATGPEFVNTYEAEGETTLHGTKLLENRDFQPGDKWTFNVVGSAGAPMPGTTSVIIEPEEGRSCEFSFGSIKYETKDIGKTYTYTITESGRIEGVTNDATPTRKVTVEVKDKGDGHLEVINSSNDTPVTYTNTYTATGKAQFTGEKTIVNRPFRTGDSLKVTVTADEGVKLPNRATITVPLTNGETTAAFSFNEINYDLSDMGGLTEKTFNYTITETATMAGTTPDTRTHTVTVKLTDDKKGHLNSEVTYSDGQKVEFTNTYAATGEIVFRGVKTIENRKFQAGDTATIKIEAETAGAPMPLDDEVTITPTAGTHSQAYAFGKISYKLSDLPSANSTKIFHYKITETESNMAGVTKDSREYKAKVTVTDDGSGNLTVTCDIDKDAVHFTNTYDANGKIVFSGTKFIENRDFQTGDAAVIKIDALTEGAKMPANDTVRVEAASGNSKTYAFGEIVYTLADAGGANSSKEYKYKVTESGQTMKGVTKDETTYEITVTVADTGTGQLTVTSDVNKDALDFTNTYAARGSIEFKGTKFIDRRSFKAGDTASFKIEAVTKDAPMPAQSEVTIDPTSGSKQGYAFEAIIYELSNLSQGANSTEEFKYRVTESVCRMDGVTKDDTVYDITVTVTDNGTGRLIVTSNVDKDALNFTNTYDAEGSIMFGGTKTIENRDFQAGDSATIKIEAVTQNAPMPDLDEVDIAANSGNGIAYQFGAIAYKLSDIPNGAGRSTQYKYKVTESEYDMAGVTKDEKVYNITVTVKDTNTGTLTVESNVNKEALNFINTYEAKGETPLNAEKQIQGRDFQAGDKWTFTVTAEEGTPMPEKTSVTIEPVEGQIAEIDFGKISYTQADDGKTYTYTITESGTVAGVTNDSEKTVRVTVKDNKDGTLTISNSAVTTKPVFVNTYKAVGDTELKGEKQIENRDFRAGDKWTFKVTAEESTPMPELTEITIEPKEGKVEALNFGRIVYTQADIGKIYTYTIAETGEVNRVTNDTAKTVKVSVEDNGNGTLKVANSTDEKPLVFVNTYEADGETTLKGVKQIENRDFQAGDKWTFTVTAEEGTPMPEQTDVTIEPKEGKSFDIDFGKIKYTQADVDKIYEYTITESGNVAGVTNASAKTVTVKVEDKGDGTLNVSNSTSNEPLEFVNTYKVAGDTELKAEKQIENRDFQAGDKWTFTVTAEEGTPMPEKTEVTIEPTSGKTAAIDFGKIAYTQADAGKTYTYTITESGEVAGVKNDTTKIVTVSVKDNKDGTLTITNSAVTEKPVFVNTYEAKNETTLEAEKQIENRDFQAGDKWTFTVTAEEGTPMPEKTEVTIEPTSGKTAAIDFGKIAYTQADDGKTYTYTITESGEVAGVKNDTTKTVTVSVTDNKDGTLTITNSAVTEKAVFVNTYEAKNETTLEAEKQIENRDFQAGDKWTFTVTAEEGTPMPEKTEVTIEPTSGKTAAIDFGKIAYTQADAGKTYTYTITESGEVAGVKNDTMKTVTVSVEDNKDGTLTITNSAVTEKPVFVNTYDTSVKVTIPGTKVLTGEALKNGQFAFNIEAVTMGAPMPVQTQVSNDANGGFSFGPIEYTLSKFGTTREYVYRITEDQTGVNASTHVKDNILYDQKAIEVTVTLAYNDVTGELTASVNKDASAVRFTNTPQYVEVTVNKQWFNGSQEVTGTIQNASVTLALKADGQAIEGVAPVTLNDPWTHTWTKLPKYTDAGELITYTVVETSAKLNGKELLTEEKTANVEDGAAILENPLPTTELSGTKTWLDTKDTHKDPTLTLKRKAGEGAEEIVRIAPTWSGTGNVRTYTYSDLPKCDNNGVEYVYSVEEVVPEGYTMIQKGNDFINIELTSIVVNKLWLRNGNAVTGTPLTYDGKQITEIKIALYRKVGSSDAEQVETYSLTAADNWTRTIDELPKYDEDGNEIIYTVEELEKPDGYSVEVVMKDGVATITNSINVDAFPETGGSGTGLYYGVGAALLILAVVLLIIKRKRNT